MLGLTHTYEAEDETCFLFTVYTDRRKHTGTIISKLFTVVCQGKNRLFICAAVYCFRTGRLVFLYVFLCVSTYSNVRCFLAALVAHLPPQ